MATCPSNAVRLLTTKSWTRQMEEDAAGGKLDFLFAEAEKERAAAKLRDWPEER